MESHVKIRKRVILGFKLAVSLFFIGIILKWVRANDIARHIATINPWWFLSLFPMAFIIIWISCLKWQRLLGSRRREAPILYLVGLYILGYFFSNFLPSMVGGDGARGYYLGKRLNQFKIAYLSVFLERLTGLFAMIAIVSVLAIGNHPVVQHAGVRLSLIFLTLLMIGAIIALFTKSMFQLFLRLIPSRFTALHEKLSRAHEALISFRQHPAEVAYVMLLSLAFHLLAGVNIYIACRALNTHPGLWDVILVTPLIMLVSTLPISLNGAGLWEGSFVVFLAMIGVPESVAVTAALLLRLKTLMISVLGWMVYLAQREKPKSPAEMDT